jgi:hypothetical protein
MARILDENRVARFNFCVELGQGLIEVAAIQVESSCDLEAHGRKLVANRSRIAHGLFKFWHFLVVVVANDECESLGGVTRRYRCWSNHQNNKQQKHRLQKAQHHESLKPVLNTSFRQTM